MQQEVLRAFKFALDPTSAQAEAFTRHAGTARWAFNHALGMKMAAHQQWRREVQALVDQGVPEAEARTKVRVPVPSAVAVQKHLNLIKGDSRTGGLTDGVHGPGRPCPWWHEVSTYAFQAAFRDADRAWANWLASVAGHRAGRKIGYPRFKKKGRSRDSFRIHHDVKKPTIRLDGYRRLLVPRLGSVRLHNSAKRLARLVGRGHAVVQSVTISRAGNRWYASVLACVTQDIPDRPSRRQNQAGTVGVDLGVKTLAALSAPIAMPGRAPALLVPNPRHLAADARRLAKAQRALARTAKGSNRRRNAARRVSGIHHRISERRATYLHTVTKLLASGYATVAAEDLNVSGMSASARGTVEAPGKRVRQKAGLNRSILDASPGEFRRQLTYKTSWYGSRLAVCERFFPSSKTCSACGWQNPRLTLADRVFACAQCELVIDRDLNAARNIAAHAVPVPQPGTVASGTGETKNARGAAKRPATPRGGRQAASKREDPAPAAGPPRESNPPAIPNPREPSPRAMPAESPIP
ncbi:RNA-guided endonuclease TnpB family protein [Streptomyces mirabilis]|uniref:RNA-guided endonuclease TnpB family protein n=1 Tax=Streptomyces mirabilis TaxID=68239 RepID=A0ABU3V639_9ACTN|nr:RNA-guided endonuclease TnpB family protein [Streptomyces mirabilis]MCX5355613.1 RNA-guided endonuclease TnpB family protein [Streptomyces mirabilis]MDU9001259.1 RNA-guided endonuclease TnpB family protein [Streptomyces mirabilis]